MVAARDAACFACAQAAVQAVAARAGAARSAQVWDGACEALGGASCSALARGADAGWIARGGRGHGGHWCVCGGGNGRVEGYWYRLFLLFLLFLLCVEGRDGHVVVVDVERGVGGIVVDGRAVARFGDRVKVVGKRRARGRRVRTADEALASVVGGHEVEGRLCCRFFRVVGI